MDGPRADALFAVCTDREIFTFVLADVLNTRRRQIVSVALSRTALNNQVRCKVMSLVLESFTYCKRISLKDEVVSCNSNRTEVAARMFCCPFTNLHGVSGCILLPRL